MNNLYEKTGLLNRLKESAVLFLFIFLSLLASLIIMNLVIYPVALFSIKNDKIFTNIVKYLFWFIISISIIYVLVKRFIYYKKNDLANIQIIKKILLKPASFLLFLLLLLISILIFILIINFILQKNYYLIYKIINF
jgi:hypothetical protein